MYSKLSWAALALLSSTASARMWVGSCPKIDWDTGFDSARFAGQWYEQLRDGFFSMEMDQKCMTGNHVLRPDGALDSQWRLLVPMDMMTYSSSPVIKMDCSKSFACTMDIENWEKDDDYEKMKEEKGFEFGILGTDYDNWYAWYACGVWEGMLMETVSIMGKSEKIDDKYIEEAKNAINAKLPDFNLNPLLMKDGGQGSFWLGLGKCEYDWNLVQKEKFQ